MSLAVLRHRARCLKDSHVMNQSQRTYLILAFVFLGSALLLLGACGLLRSVPKFAAPACPLMPWRWASPHCWPIGLLVVRFPGRVWR